MTRAPRLRKLALTAHVAASVGWLGTVAAFLALAVVGVTSEQVRLVRAVHLVAEPMVRLVILPLAFASLLTGLVSSVVTHWGVLRHYWVVFKLFINLFAALILLMYTETLASFADRAADPVAALSQLRAPTFVLHAAGALLLLLVATVLGIYKPGGVTGYGRRKQQAGRAIAVP